MQGKLKGKRTLGFYIQLLLLAGALASMALFGAWKVLWAVFVAVPMMLTTSVKPFFWKWTEARLRADAEGGNVKRAVWWDYLAVVLDWMNDFVCFVVIAWTVFALARGSAMPTSFKWICVGAISATPFAYQGGGLGYSVWNYMFWYQWGLIATAIVSTFCPISGFQGIAIQIAVALVSIPLTCRFKKAEIVGRVKSCQRNAGMSRASQGGPSGSFGVGGAIFDMQVSMLKEVRICKIPFALSLAMFVVGLVLSLCQGVLWVLLAAVLAIVLGFFARSLYECPDLDQNGNGIDERGIDVDLATKYINFRAFMQFVSLTLAAMVVLYLGGMDLALLASIALLAVAACNSPFSYVILPKSHRFSDPLHLLNFLVAFTVVIAIRIHGGVWWECLLPLPTFAYLVPVIRYFFPRSGLRGAARLAAIAEIPRRLAADTHSEGEKAADAKRERALRKRERRMGRFRRSRGR